MENSPPHRFRRRSLWPVAIVVGVWLGAVGYWYAESRSLRAHAAWFHRVRDAIQALPTKRPPEVPPGQWEFVVGWTINLHGNCGSIPRRNLPAEWVAFAEELERKLQGRVDLSTIDWIWDEYVRLTPHGQTYSDKYRPTRPENLAQAPDG